MGAIITGFKVVSGFFSAYKWIIGSVAVTGFATALFVYIDNHGEMKATIQAQDQRIAQLIADNRDLDLALMKRNVVIEQLSLLQNQLIVEAKARIAAAKKEVVELRKDRDLLTEELGIARFEILEAIRDDENFADWVDADVPPAGWSLLRSAADSD
jgi:hypothetical protein